MGVAVTINGTGYTFPSTSDTGWGTAVTSWAQAVSQHLLQKSGGTFTLSADVDFGASKGLVVQYIKSKAAGVAVASAGVIRFGNNESVKWRNAANNADLALVVDASNLLVYNSTLLLTNAASSVQTTQIADVNVTAAKLATSAVTSAKIADANVTADKLATSVATTDKIADVNVTAGKLATSAVTTAKIADGNVTSAKLDSNIARSKLEAGTASHVIVNAANGALSSEATLAKSKGGCGADMSAVTFPSTGTIPIATAWVSFTPTIATGSPSISAGPTGKWRRVGDSMEIQIAFTSNGTAAVATTGINMVPTYTVDSTKMAGATYPVCGVVHIYAGTSTMLAALVNPSTSIFYFSPSSGGLLEGDDTVWGNPSYFSAFIIVPISGWS